MYVVDVVLFASSITLVICTFLKSLNLPVIDGEGISIGVESKDVLASSNEKTIAVIKKLSKFAVWSCLSALLIMVLYVVGYVLDV
jgi:hypothetical protein